VWLEKQCVQSHVAAEPARTCPLKRSGEIRRTGDPRVSDDDDDDDVNDEDDEAHLLQQRRMCYSLNNVGLKITQLWGGIAAAPSQLGYFNRQHWVKSTSFFFLANLVV